MVETTLRCASLLAWSRRGQSVSISSNTIRHGAQREASANLWRSAPSLSPTNLPFYRGCGSRRWSTLWQRTYKSSKSEAVR